MPLYEAFGPDGKSLGICRSEDEARRVTPVHGSFTMAYVYEHGGHMDCSQCRLPED